MREPQRFEQFAIKANLEGKPVGTIVTNVLPTADGYWTIRVDYLSTKRKQEWRKISVYDDAED